jgi:WD40 repeat protein
MVRSGDLEAISFANGSIQLSKDHKKNRLKALPALKLTTSPNFAFFACVSPDGSKVACCTYTLISVWDFASRKLLHTFRGAGFLTQSLCFSPDGSKLIGSMYESIVIHDDVFGRGVCTSRESLCNLEQFEISSRELSVALFFLLSVQEREKQFEFGNFFREDVL